jgi:histidyl-tRNA synthetase
MPEDRQAHRKAFAEYVAPKLDQFCEDCQRRFHTNPLRMFDCKEEGCIALLKDAPLIMDYLSEENKKHFENVMRYLEVADISHEVDKRLVRGLDYYSRTAWEIKSDKLGSQDSLSGGGRYDLLVEQLGGPPTPGIGFAAGIERIIMAMPKSDTIENERKLGVFVASMDNKYRTEAFRLIDKVRGIGVPADIDYLGKSLKVQMKQANKSGMSHVIILAENELTKGMVAVKNMSNSEQFEVELEKIYKLTDSTELGELLGREH